jgi:hypothetical protein
MTDGYGSANRQKHLAIVARGIQTAAQELAYKGVAQIRARGLSGVGATHPVVREILSSAKGLMPAAIDFDWEAAEYELRRLAVDGQFFNPFDETREKELCDAVAKLVGRLAGMIRRSPTFIGFEKIATEECRTVTRLICNEIEVEYAKLRDDFALRVRSSAAAGDGQSNESNVPPGVAESAPEESPAEKRAQWLAKAMLLVRDNPDWSDARIAKEVGVHPSQLTPKRCPEYQVAAGLARASKTGVPQGYVTIDSATGLRDVEAVAAPIAKDDQSDRGQPVTGSKYFREYCSCCGEPMKVTPEKVGTKPVCDHCKA